MGLRLQVVSRHRQSLGERGIKEFGQNGGTIGRSLESDWVLPDGQRFLSSRHASIDYRSGSYYVIDTSTNGVYINDAEQPVGRGNPQRLFAGDRMRIGDYEIVVEIDEVDNTREQMGDYKHVDPVDAKQRVEAPDPTSYDLVDAYEITGVGIEELLDQDEAETLSPLSYKFKADELSLEQSAPRAKPWTPPSKTAKAKTASSRPAQQASQRHGQRPPDQPQPAAQAAERQALHAFFRGAGLTPPQLDDKAVERTMHLLGQLLREVIVGVTESLQLRASQKAALRRSNTTIQRDGNNVLKFSAGVDEALNNLLFRESEQYLSAVESVREAFGDLKTHQQALLKSVEVAVDGFIARLDPDELEEKFSKGKRGTLMGAASKLKYWDLYRDLYLVVSQHPAGELPHLFLEELSQAYERESARDDERRDENQKVASNAS